MLVGRGNATVLHEGGRERCGGCADVHRAPVARNGANGEQHLHHDQRDRKRQGHDGQFVEHRHARRGEQVEGAREDQVRVRGDLALLLAHLLRAS